MKTLEDIIEKEEAELDFVHKIRRMLDEVEEYVACWSVDGKSFYVLNQKIFESYILSRYFKHKDFSSFKRQLDYYGFQRIDQHQYTVNFGVKMNAGRSYQYAHPMLRQEISPESLLRNRLYKPQEENYMKQELSELDLDEFSEMQSRVREFSIACTLTAS